MQIPTTNELANILDTAKIAVDESKFGPLFQYPDPTNPIDKQVNQVALTIYLHLLTAMLKGLENDA